MRTTLKKVLIRKEIKDQQKGKKVSTNELLRRMYMTFSYQHINDKKLSPHIISTTIPKQLATEISNHIQNMYPHWFHNNRRYMESDSVNGGGEWGVEYSKDLVMLSPLDLSESELVKETKKEMKKAMEPRPSAMVKITNDYRKSLLGIPNPTLTIKQMLDESYFIYIGEIPQMKGHCTVMGKEGGVVYTGYHIEDFVELTDEEI